MKIKNILIALLALVAIVTGCMNEEFEGLTNPSETTTETSSVITLTTSRVDGVINLSVDAPHNSQANLWIDLDGDGVLAQDGSENISLLNSYQAYRLSPGLKTVSLYGDITYLACASNELTAIDVSGNPTLTTLNAPLNKLTALDVSKNSALTHLDFSGNKVYTIDISQNRALVSLWSFNNQLLELNLSNNLNLTSLDCSGNRINRLDVTKNSELVRLVCYNNQLTSLDISNNNKLNRLWLFGNAFSDMETERITNVVNQMSNVDLWIADYDNM